MELRIVHFTCGFTRGFLEISHVDSKREHSTVLSGWPISILHQGKYLGIIIEYWSTFYADPAQSWQVEIRVRRY